jgi:hypothetical protein
MANANSIYGAKLAAPLANPTAASVFLTQDSVTANAASSSLPTKAAVIYLPEVEVDSVNLGNNAGVKWPIGAVSYNVRLTGRVAAGTSGSFGVAVQIGSSTTAGSNTTLFTGGTPTYNLLGDFQLALTLIYDPTSKLLSGTASSIGGTTAVAIGAVALTSQTVDLSLGKVALCATGIFGTSNANNVANLDSFTLEVVG